MREREGGGKRGKERDEEERETERNRETERDTLQKLLPFLLCFSTCDQISIFFKSPQIKGNPTAKYFFARCGTKIFSGLWSELCIIITEGEKPISSDRRQFVGAITYSYLFSRIHQTIHLCV